MSLATAAAALEAAPFAVAIRQGSLLFPWIESVHVLAIVIVVGVVMVMDLGLLGLASHTRRISRLLREATPYVWVAFAVAAVTGALLFSSSATSYLKNPAFQLKFVAMAAAGANMALFHLVSSRGAEAWDGMQKPPPVAQVAGLVSLACWVVVVGAARWVGFLNS